MIIIMDKIIGKNLKEKSNNLIEIIQFNQIQIK